MISSPKRVKHWEEHGSFNFPQIHSFLIKKPRQVFATPTVFLQSLSLTGAKSAEAVSPVWKLLNSSFFVWHPINDCRKNPFSLYLKQPPHCGLFIKKNDKTIGTAHPKVTQ
jgi:hypothetical protein